MDKITTHGRLRADTICMASEVFPEPDDPAIPMIYRSRQAHRLELALICVRNMKGFTEEGGKHGCWPTEGCSGQRERAWEALWMTGFVRGGIWMGREGLEAF